jgi:hypothetical protein
MRRLRGLTAVAVACAIAGPAAAEKDKKTDVKKKKKDAGEEPKAKPDYVPEISGYLQLRYQQPFDTDDDGAVRPDDFRIERARVKINGQVVEHVRYSVEFDPSVTDAVDFLKDAYVYLTYLPHHELRLGQQKTQFGYENVESSGKLYWVNRSEVSEQLGHGPTTRDLGVGLVGEIPLGCGWSIEDAITVVNGAGANAQGDDNEGKDVWGRLGGRYEYEPYKLDVRAGGSLGIGSQFDPGLDPDSVIDDYRYDFVRAGADIQVDSTYAFAVAEYLWGRNTDQQTDAEVTTRGWYAAVVGKTRWKVGPMLRYDEYAGDERYTFGAFYGTRNARLRAMVNYEHRPDRDDRLILWAQARF